MATSKFPTYVPWNAQGEFNSRTSVYNWRESNTRKLRASLGRAQAKTGLSHHVFIGDSETQAYMGSEGHDRQNAYPRVYQRTLSTLGITSGGTGVVTAAANGGSGTTVEPSGSVDSRYTFAGTWAVGGAGAYMTATATGSTATFVSDAAGTQVDVWYLGNSAAFTLTIDGGAPLTPVRSGTATLNRHTVTGLSSGVHTVVLTTSTASSVSLVGMSVVAAGGLVVHNIAQYGITAQVWVSTNATPLAAATLRQGMAAAWNTDVLFLTLGVNDIPTRTPTELTGDLTTIRNYAQFVNADVVLIGQMQKSGVSSAVWETYVSALYTLADTFNCPLIDLYHRTGGYTTSNTNLLMGDATHPNGAAHRNIGRMLGLQAAL